MKLLRCGARRVHNFDTVISECDACVTLDDLKVELVVHAHHVRDIHGNGKHNWYMHLSMADIAKIIDCAANQLFVEQPDALRDALSDSAIALNKLLLCVSGYPPPESLIRSTNHEKE